MLLCFGLAALALATDLSIELFTAHAWSGVVASMTIALLDYSCASSSRTDGCSGWTATGVRPDGQRQLRRHRAVPASRARRR